MTLLLRYGERAAIFAFLLIFAGMCWPPDGYLSRDLGRQGASNIYDFTMFVVLIAFLAVAFVVRRGEVLRLLRCAWPVLALAGFAFFSAYWSDDPLLVIRRSGTVLGTTLLGIYLVARTDMTQLVALLVKVYAVGAAASLLLIVTAPALAISDNATYVNAWRGVFSDKNALGLSCGLGVIIAVYAFRNRYGSRLLSGFTIAASLLLLQLSVSRTPIVVMAAALYAAILGSALRRRHGMGLALGFVLGIVGLAAAGMIAADWQEALAALGRDATLTNRTKIWHYALVFMAHRPWLGYGFGAFWRADGVEANQFWALVEFQAPHAHNAWLELGLGLGYAGIGLAALVWVVALYRGARLLTAAHARHVVFCLALMAGIFVENLTEYEFFRQADMLWVLFVSAFTYLGREMMAHHTSLVAATAMLDRGMLPDSGAVPQSMPARNEPRPRPGRAAAPLSGGPAQA